MTNIMSIIMRLTNFTHDITLNNNANVTVKMKARSKRR